MLYRELAPISEEAWKEIDERASEVLKNYLSGRRVVKVTGPKGWKYNVVTEGRLENIVEENDICYGTYQALPLVEARVEFDMDRWELDNLNRGAKDIDYTPLEDAVKRIALFEENTIYNGLDKSYIKGILKSAEGESIAFGSDSESIMNAISEGVLRLKAAYVEGPYTLIVGKDIYKTINSQEIGYPLEEKIKDLIGGDIVFSFAIDGAILIPYDHDDLELIIGNDFSIGYQSSDKKKVRLFVTESLTFRILDPDIIVKYD